MDLGFLVMCFTRVVLDIQARAEHRHAHCATAKPSLVWARGICVAMDNVNSHDLHKSWLLAVTLRQPLQAGRAIVLEGEACARAWELAGMRMLENYPMTHSRLHRWCQYEVKMSDGLPCSRITWVLTSIHPCPEALISASVAAHTAGAAAMTRLTMARASTGHAATC